MALIFSWNTRNYFEAYVLRPLTCNKKIIANRICKVENNVASFTGKNKFCLSSVTQNIMH